MDPNERESRRNTDARAKLVEYLASGHTQTELGKLVGVAQSTLAGWISGIARPEPEFREALQEITGIDAKLWQTEHGRSVVERARNLRVASEPAQP